MDPMQSTACKLPTVWLLGDVEHPEFVESVSLARATAEVTCVADAWQAAARIADRPAAPDLIVLASSRPGNIRSREVDALRRAAPLAGIVAILGSWCEGETRTGRPAAGVGRVYWYDFPGWWRRQLAAWADGRCPEWALPDDFGLRIADCGLPNSSIHNPQSAIRNSLTPAGLVVLDTTCWDTADALADVLRSAGFATAWTKFGRHGPQVRGAAAGIWEGRQLDDREVPRLAKFCRRLAVDEAPVLALVDFPRRDRVERARAAGAAVVLGKPWLNVDLVATLQLVIDARPQTTSPRVARAA